MPNLVECKQCKCNYQPAVITKTVNNDGLIQEQRVVVYRCPVCGTLNEVTTAPYNYNAGDSRQLLND